MDTIDLLRSYFRFYVVVVGFCKIFIGIGSIAQQVYGHLGLGVGKVNGCESW